jgi:outer membrane protein
VLSPFDVQVTETQLAREREALVTARSTVLRIEDLARALLNVQIIDFDVRPLDQPQTPALALDPDALLRRVYANSSELAQAENQLVANTLNLEEARNQERTNLDLELYYTAQGFNGSPFGGVSGFSSTDVDSYGAALTWTVPLFDVATQERIKQRTLERQQVELQLESLRSDLTVRLQSVIRQLGVAREQVETAAVARRLADEQLRNEIERFRVGESTSFQVSQAQQDASQAQVQEILARLVFERNHLSLLLLTGEIYDRYQLERRTR